jgi:hypothetical protein
LSRTRFLFASAMLVVLAAAFAACGSSDNSDASPDSVLESATLKGIESGELDATMNVSAPGKEGGNFELTVSGPFESVEGGSTPQLDLTAQATGKVEGEDVDFDGGIVLLPNSAYIGYDGANYEVDPTTFSFIESAIEESKEQGEGESGGAEACEEAAEELAVEDFADNLANEGEADVDGTATTKISGDLDVSGAIDNVIELFENPACSSQLSGAPSTPSTEELREAQDEARKAIKSAKVDVYVGDDDIIRRVTADLTIEPQDSGEGPDSATVEIDVSLSGVNEEQEITPPGSAKPLDQLFKKLGVNPLDLLGALQGEGDLEDLLEGFGEGVGTGL